MKPYEESLSHLFRLLETDRTCVSDCQSQHPASHTNKQREASGDTCKMMLPGGEEEDDNTSFQPFKADHMTHKHPHNQCKTSHE